MDTFPIQHENPVRTVCFAAVLAAMLIEEYLACRRTWQNSKTVR